MFLIMVKICHDHSWLLVLMRGEWCSTLVFGDAAHWFLMRYLGLWTFNAWLFHDFWGWIVDIPKLNYYHHWWFTSAGSTDHSRISWDDYSIVLGLRIIDSRPIWSSTVCAFPPQGIPLVTIGLNCYYVRYTNLGWLLDIWFDIGCLDWDPMIIDIRLKWQFNFPNSIPQESNISKKSFCKFGKGSTRQLATLVSPDHFTADRYVRDSSKTIHFIPVYVKKNLWKSCSGEIHSWQRRTNSTIRIFVNAWPPLCTRQWQASFLPTNRGLHLRTTWRMHIHPWKNRRLVRLWFHLDSRFMRGRNWLKVATWGRLRTNDYH